MSRVLRVTSVVALLLVALAGAPALADTAISVSGAAAIAGSFGMRVGFDGGTGNAFVQDNSPNAEKIYYAQFKLRNDSLVLADGQTHQVFRARQGGSAPVIRVQYTNPAGAENRTTMQVFAALDGGAFTPRIGSFVQSQHRVTIEWKAATAPGANNGYIRLYKGTTFVGEFTGLDNDTFAIDDVQLGAFAGVDATTSGFADFDDFISTRTAIPY